MRSRGSAARTAAHQMASACWRKGCVIAGSKKGATPRVVGQVSRLPLPDFLEACPTLPHSSQRRRVHFFAAAATIVPHMKASPCSARRDPGGTIMPGKPRVFVTRIIPEVGLALIRQHCEAEI